MKLIRKVFINELPKWDNGANKNKINWEECVGHKVNFIYKDIEGEVEIIDYKSEERLLYIKYFNSDIFKITTSSFLKCRLGKLLGVKTNEFKIEIGKIFKDDKRDLIIIDKKYKQDSRSVNIKYYQYKCNKCGFECGEHHVKEKHKKELWIQENSLLNGNGCLCCDGKIVVQGINDIPTTASWMIKYFQGGYEEAKLYTKSSGQKIYPICSDCGSIKEKSMAINRIYNNKSISCFCGDGKSYPEKFMFNILEQLKMIFESQYSPDWIKPMRYDFFFELNNKEYIIETDGGFHNKYNSFSGQTEKESKDIDNYKDLKAQEHNIEVIRIDCLKSDLEYIKKSILNSQLNELFNLSKIDWLKCEEFALSNLIKKVCDIKKSNPNIRINQIAIIINLSPSTITSYLRRGAKVGWCNFNPIEDKIRINREVGKLSGIQVEVFKNNISLGKFSSITESCKFIKENYNILLRRQSITKICINKNEEYKGFKIQKIYTI